MVFPIGDDHIKGRFKPIVSYSLIVLNVLCYAWQNTDPTGQLFVEEYGCIPAEISRGVDLHTLFSNMFMHGGFMHLLGNMMFLWVFADNIEAVVGNGRFLLFYLIGGLAASAAQILLNVDSPVPCVGASGAIAALMGAYMVMYPKSRILMLFVLNFSRFHIPALAFLGFLDPAAVAQRHRCAAVLRRWRNRWRWCGLLGPHRRVRGRACGRFPVQDRSVESTSRTWA